MYKVKERDKREKSILVIYNYRTGIYTSHTPRPLICKGMNRPKWQNAKQRSVLSYLKNTLLPYLNTSRRQRQEEREEGQTPGAEDPPRKEKKRTGGGWQIAAQNRTSTAATNGDQRGKREGDGTTGKHPKLNKKQEKTTNHTGNTVQRRTHQRNGRNGRPETQITSKRRK